jgi:hypothetical protein
VNPTPKPLSCDQAQAWLYDAVKGELSALEQLDLNTHLAHCANCQGERIRLEQLRHWIRADQVPEPTPQLQTRFEQMLAQLTQEQPAAHQSSWTNWVHQLQTYWVMVRGPQLAFTLLVLGLGITAGYWWRGQHPPSLLAQQPLDTTSEQLRELQQVMLLSLLENPLATERLQGISMSTQLPDPDNQVIDALLMTLNDDPNINVRLVALEALTRYAHTPRVRQGLVQALAHQNAPILQLALADLMVKLQEKRAIQSLRQLLRQGGITPEVKTKVEHSIRTLA